MKRYKVFSLFLAILVCFVTLTTASAKYTTTVLDKGNLFKDITTNSVNDNPKIDALIFNSSGSDIYGQIFVPGAVYTQKRSVVIMFHGFAGFTRWDDVGHELCQAGAVIVIPNHRGAWGSQGEYSVTNCIEDAVNLADYVRSEAFTQKYNTDPDSIFLLGHSMGGNTVVNAGVRINFLKGVILLAPCDVAALCKTLNDKDKRAFLIENGLEVLHSQGLEYMVKNIEDNSAQMLFTNNAEALAKLNVFAATGSEDAVCPGKLCVEPMWKLVKETDTPKIHIYKQYKAEHSLMGARIQLVKDIIDFINAANR